MFDIDGTLTQTYDADTQCFIRALTDVFGFADVDPDWSTYPHSSDSGVLEVLFQARRGRSPNPEEIAEMQRHFVALLAASADAEPFTPVPGARDLLCHLLGEPGFAVSMASGAWECSGRFKLAAAGLAFPQIPAAFSDAAHARENIMQISLERVARTCVGGSFESTTYIGDGVWDARAARNLGFRFIGRANEAAGIGRLHAEGAGHVFADYLDRDAFMAALLA
ncbi:MAG TPA: HAD family hydrolase [Chthoniobacter sp.]|jgi:phosphoglycolate phosphatase-like HAD superfamily hydrolase